ncbi:MAG TPA: MMPL family transporter, partial [Acidimicrobiales bacterium]|nr:MMPL family transporter [Acidimicrobiales bacterium]
MSNFHAIADRREAKTRPDGPRGAQMARLARWCFTRRRTVLAAWLVGLVGLFAIGPAVGASYNNSSAIPGTDSTSAQNVLTADFPVQSGDSDQVVVQAKEGTLRSPTVEEAVTSMLARVGRLPDVASVVSPYDTAGQISRDGKIGFATVNLDASADAVPTNAVSRLISTAQSADSPGLNVQLGGAAIENAEPGSFSSSFLVGILLALVVLFFAFRRSVLGALLPLISALMAIGVATSVIDLLTHAMPVVAWVPEVAVFIALGVGVDYALFVVSRHRSGLLAGRTPEEAAVIALNTSGRAVLLAGSTVCVALLGMFALQLSFLYGVAVCLAVAVALTMVASLTLLPAMLGFFGPNVLRRAERVRAGLEVNAPEGSWARWAALVGRRAAPLSLSAFGVIV